VSEEKLYEWRLGEILIQKGWVTWEHLEEALRVQSQLKQYGQDHKNVFNVFRSRKRATGLNLGEILIRHGHISWDDLADALRTQGRIGGALGEICLSKGYVTESQLYHALALQAGLIFVEFNKIKVQKSVIDLVPKSFALSYRVVPIVEKDNELLVVVSDFLNVESETKLQGILPNYIVYTAVAGPSDLEQALTQYYG